MSVSSLHALRAAEVLAALETGPAGLTPDQAQARLALYGSNALREPAPQAAWRRLAGQLTHLMALILLAAGGLAFAAGRPLLGLVIWGVVVVNATFSFWQEQRAERAVAALRRVLPAYARVLRAGQEIQLAASGLVPGDVLVLAEGDNISADARVVEEFGLRVNQATLTGEAMPARKTADPSLREGLSELERPNLVFAATSVVSGTGRAIVYATGMLTQFGRIANLTEAVQEEPSPLQRSMRRMTQRVSVVALGLGVLVFVGAILDVGLPTVEALILATGIVVATIPEGLGPTVTLSLAMAVQRLAQRGVLVKKLAGVEKLGATSVICTDKSGTLTQNEMTAREVWVGGHRLTVTGVGYEPAGTFQPLPAGTLGGDLRALLEAAALCNNARLSPPSVERPRWSALGDQTEAALRVLALKGGVDEAALTAGYPRVHELPFDARRKRMSTLHRNERGLMTFVKGAPNEVLQLCTHTLIAGQAQPLVPVQREQLNAAIDDYARRALRVLALARRELPAEPGGAAPPGGRHYTPDRIERELTFLGLVGMLDPPRPDVAEAVQRCREAGIRLVMVTGDYGLTAESIARRVGLLSTAAPRILTGAEVDAMTDAELQTALGEEVICARMAPENKLRLVAAFQARGEVVAVTGDGVNDAPALRKADVGVAMGLSGTDVAREAADVILTQDNIAAVASAIAEGRAVYDNVRKFATYIFASNVPEIMPFLAAALLHLPLALTVTQILAIDLGTDLLPALALGTERPEPNVMRRPPRGRSQPVLDAGLLARAFLWLGPVEALLCFAGFFAVYRLFGYTNWASLPHADWLPYSLRLATADGRVYVLATTVFHAGVVLAQVGNAFTCRTETERVHRLGWLSNRFLLAGAGIEIALILMLIYFRPLAALFEHAPLPAGWWVGLTLYAPAVYALDRVRKSVARRLEHRRPNRRARGPH